MSANGQCKRGHSLKGFNLMALSNGYHCCRQCHYAATNAYFNGGKHWTRFELRKKRKKLKALDDAKGKRKKVRVIEALVPGEAPPLVVGREDL